MDRIEYGYAKTGDVKGYVYALKCEEKFYVISQDAYKRILKRLHNFKPVFFTDLPVYIDGINI